VNEMVVVLGFFALMALLVSRMLRDQRKPDSQTPQVKKDKRAPVAGNERPRTSGSYMVAKPPAEISLFAYSPGSKR
jgi:hypothetical protein